MLILTDLCMMLANSRLVEKYKNYRNCYNCNKLIQEIALVQSKRLYTYYIIVHTQEGFQYVTLLLSL